ncbi:MAG: bifunctional enzyme CysN/CysC [Rhodospirillaceae bacterium]|jgi:bifunctional enzyme CysN/CysC|nr:bifunctional enzyme CysN/CysC [Rhodospirillaceae bacterium]
MSTVPQSTPFGLEPLRVVIVGHVDHGKSTLVGRLFHDTGSLPDGKLEAIKAMCERRGMPFEWAFLMDAFQSERDQGITIDTAQIWFRSKLRDYVIIDAPGHREFIKNMITGASSAEAALLMIDASHGIQQQSRLHGFLLNLLGIRQVAVVVNKMDLVKYSATHYEEIRRTYTHYLAGFGAQADYVVPISARDGDNLVHRAGSMPWYEGPTLLEALDSFRPAPRPVDLPLRLPIQDIYKFDDRRIIAGRIESGRLAVGDRLVFSPSNKSARVNSIEGWNRPAPALQAMAGESVGITLDEQIFIERGEIASLPDQLPILTNVFRGRLIWLSTEPLKQGAEYRLKLATREVPVTAHRIERIFDTEDLSVREANEVGRHGVADVILRSRAMLALDEAETITRTGRFVLTDGHNIVGGGLIDMKGYPDQRESVTVRGSNLSRVAHGVTAAARIMRNGHKGAVLWFTGLSGAGKSTLAMEVERRLFQKGYLVYVLDGDNVRYGLNANLGFSPEDRAENIRRVGEVAALFADAGMIAITAFISPYRADRQRARNAAKDNFHEIFIKADVATCERRDPKGLYKKARRGEIAEFTGVSAPYEEPEIAELIIDTASQSVEDSVRAVVDYVEHNVLFTGSHSNR